MRQHGIARQLARSLAATTRPRIQPSLAPAALAAQSHAARALSSAATATASTSAPHADEAGTSSRAASTAGDGDSRVTTLTNGVRVATDPSPGHFVATGVYVDAGSRYESDRFRGCSHLLDRMSFKSTSNRTAEQMMAEIDALGGQLHASSSRETIFYQAPSYTQALPQVLSILADTVLHPRLDATELAIQQESTAWELAEIRSKPEMHLPELVHEVAFKGNTLGNPLLCPDDRLESITPDLLREFVQTWYRPERLVVAGAGVPHEELVTLAEQHFGSMRAATPELPAEAAKLAKAKARYTGGDMYIEQPDAEFTHVYVAYEALPVNDPDLYALATLQILLGGGGSFSAGGPGKGMYSRLYTSVLNQYHQVDHCSAFHHCYADAGLFGISIAVHPTFLYRTPWLLAAQLDAVTRPARHGLTRTELARAKNQLQSSLLMALESRIVQAEDLGRQVLVHGRRVPVREMLEQIERVTLDDLHRVATRVLRPHESPSKHDRDTRSGQPTVVAQGKLDGLPDVRAALAKMGLAGKDASTGGAGNTPRAQATVRI